ncbi:hypothetical protein AVEN_189933-1 [Araneus ventricosus]|uniref:Uncharacterized protein n=1 Tax=Araneus ventricosus TaxID=182803 RepID=A0A4Y2H063_ARAVE|nr:hypothetical protein AVEN_189933-1 [Araneus ventricosus]
MMRNLRANYLVLLRKSGTKKKKVKKKSEKENVKNKRWKNVNESEKIVNEKEKNVKEKELLNYKNLNWKRELQGHSPLNLCIYLIDLLKSECTM